MTSSTTVTVPDDELHQYAGHPVRFLLRYMRHRAFAHVMVFGAVGMAIACSVLSSYGIRHLVDIMTASGTGGPGRSVWQAVGLLIGLIIADNISWRVAGWFASGTFVAVTGDIRQDLFRFLTGHSPAYFADRMPTSLAVRIATAGNVSFVMENMLAWNVLPPALNVLLSVILMLSVSGTMGCVTVVTALGLCFLMFKLAVRGRRLHGLYAEAAAGLEGETLDVMGNIALVRAFGMRGRERMRFNTLAQHEMGQRLKSLRYMERLRMVHAAMTAVLTTGLLLWAVLLWQWGQATVGQVVMVITLGFAILHGTRDLAMSLVETIQHNARLSEVLSALLIPHDMPDAADATVMAGPVKGDVDFRDVSFSYPNGSAVLNDFNLHITPGTRVGLVGRSGSGKSTVLALLQRLRFVNGGKILIDGQDIRGLTDDALRSCLSIVPQDVSLLHRSVLENIRYGRPDATDTEVQSAAQAAGCRDFIEAMSEGFNTIVGDRGVKLSGGQRQRIAIARAFLRNAPILILDEATSALDTESEEHVQQALDRLMIGRTVIAVAHRLSTLRNFDRIVVMQDGKIVEDGPPGVLEQQDGPYNYFLSKQVTHA
ncbi:ABC transporter ATP-binding protein [Acetobacter cibinongensis]|uniref:ABC transporter ATP-binding protein n=1 Tax=Acetobacter cibinongensis TaxID=146475 RepID=A0A0D6N0B9_9PROT|nr:ABC transporter ATP-binding protein [Acetobacter cibinongensis]GAN59018.1 ABC transporter multidrug resistance [Acetobacter cibinongensis]GBQ19826.1 multidrug ABC transporter ATP-binding protein [Acetobacter cibinongensis NRIC 0482]GEL58882.1 ABC transporter ATP-binding protein [Acetobacter cibinongensis]